MFKVSFEFLRSFKSYESHSANMVTFNINVSLLKKLNSILCLIIYVESPEKKSFETIAKYSCQLQTQLCLLAVLMNWALIWKAMVSLVFSASCESSTVDRYEVTGHAPEKQLRVFENAR